MSGESVGSRIARLRKSRNLSQSELAELLNITHQAVSKWERGDSLPDVGILLPLASLFGISVDELLRGSTPAAEPRSTKLWGRLRASASDARPPAAAEIPPAPVVAAASRGEPSVETLRDLAPFTPSAVLDQLVAGLEGFVGWEAMLDLGPFMTPPGLARTVESAPEPPPAEILGQLAPFLPAQVLAELVRLRVSGVWSQETVLALAPFLEEDVVERLVTAELADPPSWEGLVELAPFLPKKTVADLLERLMAPSRGA